MCSVDGADRVGLRVCPGFPFNDVKDPDPQETFTRLLGDIQTLGMAYLHIMRATTLDAYVLARDFFKGPFIINGGFDTLSATAAIEQKGATAVSFATSYIANPDLVQRMRDDLPLSEVNQNTLYSESEAGYSDYPYSR